MFDERARSPPSPVSSSACSHGGERGPFARRGFGVFVAALVVFAACTVVLAGPLGIADTEISPLAVTISIDVVRTGSSEASVIGFTDGAGESIDVLVNGRVAASGTVSWIGEYWIPHVPVADGASVKTRIGIIESPTVTVPDHASQRVGPPGFVYTQGSRMFLDGSPIALTGVNEATAFSYALLTWGYGEAGDAGKNQLFPSGPDTRIPGIATPDELWREYFRYFLHYRESTDPDHPAPNLLRIWIVDLNWGPFAYHVWETRPSTFYEIFDRMLYWADRAGVYIVPVIGQNSIGPADNAYYDRSSLKYARHLAFARDLLDRYDSNPTIAMWDLWNEADVLNDVYWAAAGGITAYRSWMAGLVGDLRGYSESHSFTVGSAQWPDFPGLPAPFGVRRHFLFNNIPGLDVAHEHAYFGVEDSYLIDWRAEWAEALGIPYFVGEYGYNGQIQNPLGYGYWPWFTREWRAADVGPLGSMVWLDNGKGAFADYPYLGALPEYPPDIPGANEPPNAAFVYAPTAPKAGEAVRFDGSSSSDDSGVVSASWAFGDGQTGSGSIVDHVYGSAGTYSATLTVRDAAGASDSATVSITVGSASPPPNGPPQASFSFSPTNPLAGDPIRFDASASTDDRGIVASSWTFGDGQVAQGQVVNHAFAVAGSYAVSLTVRDADGATDSVSAVVTVAPGPTPPNDPPHAAFSYSPQDPELAEPVQFDAGSSTDDRGIVAYQWAFGDGQVATGRLASHAFAASGTYDVTLTVRDADGASDARVEIIVVGSSAPPPPNLPPYASFTLTPQTPRSGETVRFDASASSDDDGIVLYSWDFGDGQTGQGTVVTHAYPLGGQFNATLTVRDAEGASDSAQTSVRVNGSPIRPKPRVIFASWDPDRSRLDIGFSASMDHRSVEANLWVTPTTSYRVGWEDDSRLFVVLSEPRAAMSTSTYFVVIAGTATDASGEALTDSFSFAIDLLAQQPPSDLAWPFAVGSAWFLLAVSSVMGLIAMAALLARRQRQAARMRTVRRRVRPRSTSRIK